MPRTPFLPGLALVLASAVLLAPVLAAAQPLVPRPPPLDPSELVPDRMPRPGSSHTFERGGSGHAGHSTAQQRFEEANTTQDGHLTEAQAQADHHMRGVAKHFAEIDDHHRGYVTFEEIRSWRAARREARQEERDNARK